PSATVPMAAALKPATTVAIELATDARYRGPRPRGFIQNRTCRARQVRALTGPLAPEPPAVENRTPSGGVFVGGCGHGGVMVTHDLRRLLSNLAALVSLIAAALAAYPAGAAAATSPSTASTACQLSSARGQIQHVINVQFDNTHFIRDNPNVPSDLEQMPNLLNFIKGNGTLLSNHHTPLISHTATDILTSLTGVYGDRHGVPVSNSFRYFNPDGTSNTGVSFAYWTDSLFDPTTSTPTDTLPNMPTADGKNAPAPWVPFTRAGCNVGAVATANTILENIATDIPTVFGANSPRPWKLRPIPARLSPTLSASGFTARQAMPCAALPMVANP